MPRPIAVAAIAATAFMSLLANTARAAPKDFETYAAIAGEVFEAGSTCRLQADKKALLELGARFRSSVQDPKAEEKVHTIVVGMLVRAAQRRQRQGEDVFCREMLAAYGPSGSVVRGLLGPE